jgi:hypothetical protein
VTKQTAGHIVVTVDDKRALCGESRKTAVGITLARWAQRHIDGHAPEWCAGCFAAWSTTIAVSDAVVHLVAPL